ncbi:hypothetical protein [Sorangium sp. So ce385]|uniref:hypothetical protein n=1 Tax=Sorangium sp. So ce385 TaxID=3133308 RepID=UPI003F5C17A3
MTTKDKAKRLATTKRTTRASRKPKKGDAQEGNGGLTRKQALALWELVIKGDGKTASQRSVKLDRADVKGLESARLITVESGKRKNDPAHGAKLHLTDAAWDWANRQGLAVRLSQTKAAVPVLEALLAKVRNYLEYHNLALAHLLRPRPADKEQDGVASTAVALQAGPAPGEAAPAAPGEAAPAALEERIRAAYLHVTGGALNQYVRLALLRAQLRDEPVEAVDAVLRGMQEKGGAVLYPIDDPQRIRPEDDAAALRVSGERRDLLCIEG